jgi:hypothetical protein
MDAFSYSPRLRIAPNLFNRDERVLLAFQEAVDVLKRCVAEGGSPAGDAVTAKELVNLVAQGQLILGAVNQKVAQERTSIGEALENLRAIEPLLA